MLLFINFYHFPTEILIEFQIHRMTQAAN